MTTQFQWQLPLQFGVEDYHVVGHTGASAVHVVFSVNLGGE